MCSMPQRKLHFLFGAQGVNWKSLLQESDPRGRIISIDACFSLVKRIGRTHGDPLHEAKFFLAQDAVDQFVASYSDAAEPDDKVGAFQNIYCTHLHI